MDIAASVVAVLAAAVALLNTAYTTRLNSRLQAEREAKSKAELLDELMDRYREPLLQAAYDLQSRIYNIVDQGFLATHYLRGTEATKEYARENTLYVLADYLGWIEILRREVRFLELGDEAANRAWTGSLTGVRNTLLSDAYPPCFRLFKGQQRAIGEIMMQSASRLGDERLETLGYAAFLTHQKEPEFDRWLAHLRADVDELAHGPDGDRDQRLRALQHALVDLIDFLDPGHIRVPTSERAKLSMGKGPRPADVHDESRISPL